MMARTMAVVMTVGQSGSAVDGDSTKESDAGDDRLMVVATRVMMIYSSALQCTPLPTQVGPFSSQNQKHLFTGVRSPWC